MQADALHWNSALNLSKGKLTAAQARKTFCTLGVKYTGRITAEMGRMTFCTLGDRYTGETVLETNFPVLFKIPDQQLMDVTHHKSHDQFQSYVVNATWRDPEAEAHAARTFSLWAQDHYKPPVTSSVPDALGRMNDNHESAFGSLKQTQVTISTIIDVDSQRTQEHPS